MRKLFSLLLASAALFPSSAAISQRDSIFIYSPDFRQGLHAAVRTSDGWKHLGQLCSSDYGTWGAEKRMYHPSLCRANDGSWRLVFQVNDRAPLFAAAYSADLVNWRPQDYPRVATGNCLEPVVHPAGDGFDIVYTSGGAHYRVKATPDFRHFTAGERISDSELQGIVGATKTEDRKNIDGKECTGQTFLLTAEETARIRQFFDERAEDGRKSSERMHDDKKNLASLPKTVGATLTVDMSRQKPISDKLIGIFFEDISYAADGGLYAELVQNRDFEYTEKDHGGWNATTAWHSSKPIEIATEHPLHPNNPHYALLWPDTIWNEGWDGIVVEAGKKYDFSMYVLAGGQKQDFSIQLVGHDGTLLAKSKLKTRAGDWQQYSTVLTATASDNKARLVIVPLKAAHVGIDMVSLFPQETFMGRKNGLRRDLAQVIADLHPKFVRFPGGCMSHGQGLENIYHWNHTVGPLQDRKPDFNIWHYHQTRGLGFYEFFQFCEDIGAEPLPVLAAGVPCQNSANNAQGIGGQQGGIPMDQMPADVQEILDRSDWANGDPATSQWAKMRADAGHPAPFNLKYIGLGNEDIISTVFEERYEMLCRAIRAKYPDIRICGTAGPFHAPSADYQEGWDFSRRQPDLQYMLDEHYYESTGWFMHNRHYYDSYDRQGAKVYLGEWAASTRTKRPNVETALAEALYLTDVERNSDVVEMTSYAPMLCKDGHSNWNPDMIYFSNTDVRTTPAYEVQRLFSVYGGDTYIASSFSGIDSTCQHRVGASVVRNSKTGKTYLKLVNALPVELSLTVSGLDIPADTPTEGFAGTPEEQRLTITKGTAGDAIVLPAYSFRVIKL
jgi:alpha-L-arabinofuranosidase